MVDRHAGIVRGRRPVFILLVITFLLNYIMNLFEFMFFMLNEQYNTTFFDHSMPFQKIITKGFDVCLRCVGTPDPNESSWQFFLDWLPDFSNSFFTILVALVMLCYGVCVKVQDGLIPVYRTVDRFVQRVFGRREVQPLAPHAHED